MNLNPLRLIGMDRESRDRRALERLKPRLQAEFQRQSLFAAKWNCDEARVAFRQGNERAAVLYLGRSILPMMMAHMRGPNDILSGYSLDLSLADIAARLDRAKQSAIVPKMLEILRCEVAEQKAVLTCQFTYIIMCLLDSSGFPVQDEIFCHVLEAPAVNGWQQRELREGMGEYLKPLGFKPHDLTEDGRKYTLWYWPEAA